MKLQDANLLVNAKNSCIHVTHVFCFHFLRIHPNYSFRRGFESVREQFLSGNISGK